MEVIADGSDDGIALPLSTSFARDASFVERPCDSCCRHSIVFNLPGHVVNDVLLLVHSVVVKFVSHHRLLYT